MFFSKTADSLPKRFERWQAGATAGPWALTIMPTNRCNLRCSMCWQRGYDYIDPSELSDARWLQLVDEAADLGVQTWNISGGGEPLVRGDLVMDLCRRICHRGMKGILQTNGVLLSASHAAALIDIQWPHMVVSIDGPNAKINDTIRSVGSFERAVDNVRRLTTLRQNAQSSLPRVSIHMVLSHLNYRELEQMVELTHELRCDVLELSSMIDYSPACHDLLLTEEDRGALPGYLAAAEAHAETLELSNNIAAFYPATPSDTSQEETRIDSAIPAGIIRSKCFEPWLSLTIFPEGKVSPCCLFCDKAADSIAERSLVDVWHGVFLQSMRDFFGRGAIRAECRTCLSNMLTRNEAFRQRLQMEQLNAVSRFGVYVHKARSSIRQYGVRRTIRRAFEWMHIGKEW